MKSWCILLLLLPATVVARAIMGIDLGSLYMKVALVQSGSPLEIVTNLHSKRKTEQMVLFDNSQRFYGADANALIARKSQKTPTQMSIFLGRDADHPVIQAFEERHFPVVPYYNETRHGMEVIVNDEIYTPEELTAMVLQHASEISVAYAIESGSKIAPPRDCVITVPSFATQHVRRAYLDAAELAGLNVLGLLEENTAAALQYAMDKNFEKPEIFLFYNMGGNSVEVLVVKFFNYDAPQKYGKPKSTPALQILGKAWDETIGGLAFDHVVVEYLADEFNQVWHAKEPSKKDTDIRTIPRAMTKLRLEANKVKHVLSANTERPVYIDGVHDDVSLQTHLTRAKLEELCSDLLKRAVLPISKALNVANVTTAELTGMELVGGGMRIPKIQSSIQEVLGELELGLHMNADEAFALGAAFAGANVSTAFRVRQVGLTDLNPWGISVSLANLEADEKKAGDEEPWSKQATIFKSWGRMGVKKTIAFTHDEDVHCELNYAEPDELPKGSQTELERYDITGVAEFAKEMQEKGLGKPKVSLQFELSSSGITSLLKAEASVEETYTVEEEVEVDDDEAANATDATETNDDGDKKEPETPDEEAKAEEKKDDEEAKEETPKDSKIDGDKKDGDEEKKEEKKPKKKIKVEKEKKKLHKKSLTVKKYFVGRIQPLTEELLEESKAKLEEMARKDKERVLLEESKNKVESYIYKVKNKLVDDEETIEKFTTKKQREEVKKLAEKAEDWLYDDGYNADLATMEDKYAELSVPFEKILLRISESTARPEAIEKLQTKLSEIEALMAKWVESKPQVTEEERQKVLDAVEEARKWIEEKEKAQKKKKPHDDPVFLSTEVPAQSKPIETLVVRLNRKPKPKPPKVDKNETASANATDTNATDPNATDADAKETPADAAENKTDDAEADKAEESNSDKAETSESTKEEEPAESQEKGEPVQEEL